MPAHFSYQLSVSALVLLAAALASAQVETRRPAATPSAGNPANPSYGGVTFPGAVQIPIYPRTQSRFASPAAVEAAKHFADLETISLNMARQLKALDTKDGATGEIAEERDRLRAKLKETLSQAFDARQKLQQLEVEELKQRLAKVEGGLEKREANKDQIVENRLAELLNENQELRWNPNAEGTTQTPTVSHILPSLEGVVLAVSDSELVEVSLGSDDGLKTGHPLDVFRGLTYLGRVKVVLTKPDVSVTRILKPYHKGPIRKGDRVRTKVDSTAQTPPTHGQPRPAVAPAQEAPPRFPRAAAPHNLPPPGGPAPRYQPQAAEAPAEPEAPASAPGRGAAPLGPPGGANSALHSPSNPFSVQQQNLLGHLAETRKALIDTGHALREAERRVRRVREGQLGLEIEQVEAERDLARRHADRVRREYESQLRLLKLNEQTAEARLEKADNEYERAREINARNENVISQSEMQSLQTAVKLAVNELDYARTLLNLHREATTDPDPKDEKPKDEGDAASLKGDGSY
ncbi:MAG: hypothetical protein KY475_13600 [Planctomycetes bacterium]|nr:hypothetical protein [Planctomycetota bacterium]